MLRTWLNLAVPLLLGSTGCFGSHGGSGDPDAGADGGRRDTGPPDTTPPPIDGGSGCTTITPRVSELVCPESALEGTTLQIEVTLANGGCCDGGETTSEITDGPGGVIVVESRMEICDCCAMCECIGPIVTTDVTLPSLPVGRHEVQAGALTCEIEVLPAAACRPQGTTEVRMPRAVFDDQSLPISMISEAASGCSCIPRMRGSLDTTVGMEVCNCCDECACIDPGYEVGTIQPTQPAGERMVYVEGHGPRPLSVFAAGSCREGVTPTAVRVERPTSLLRSGPALTWIVVSGEATVCCVEPMYALRTNRTGNFFDLSIADCTSPVDCECVPPGPTRFEAWHALGELSPGSYSVAAGGEVVTFTID